MQVIILFSRRGNKIILTVWGKLVDFVNENALRSRDTLPIIIITSVTVKTYKGTLLTYM